MGSERCGPEGWGGQRVGGPKGVGPNGAGPKVCGPKPRKRGARRVERPKGGGPKGRRGPKGSDGWEAQNFALFSLSCRKFRSFFSLDCRNYDDASASDGAIGRTALKKAQEIMVGHVPCLFGDAPLDEQASRASVFQFRTTARSL